MNSDNAMEWQLMTELYRTFETFFALGDERTIIEIAFYGNNAR